MRHLREEVEEKVRGALGAGEMVVRTLRVKKGWLVLTDRRLLMFHASPLGHPEEVVVDEPLQRIEAEPRWMWSKLESRLVIRRPDGRVVRVGLRNQKGQKTGWDRMRTMRGMANDIRHWTRVVEITEEQAATGQKVDAAFAHVRARAIEALTPAQLARNLGLDPQHVRDVLTERFGIVVSKGAALKYRYTKRDRSLFDDAVKEKLFAALVDEFGTDEIIRRSGGVVGEWWETPVGAGFENVLGVFGGSAAHVSQQRAPIARWQSTFVWIGLVGVLPLAVLIFPPLAWQRSFEGWRSGASDRPDAAITMGMLTAGLVVGLVIVGQIANLIG